MDQTLETYANLARRLRYWSLRMSTEATSGHPTSSLSAADLLAVWIHDFWRYDSEKIDNLHNDRILFSKGHASPLFYAVFEAIGVLSEHELLQYRKAGSVLEGHPTPRFAHTIAATGSLGMGLGIGCGLALALRRSSSLARTLVLMGDGEMAEGSVWEAIAFAAQQKLNSLIAVIDVNRLGQSGETAYGHNVQRYTARIQAFGWETISIDGHDYRQIKAAYEQAVQNTSDRPVAIVAKTIKGSGVSFLEDHTGWHGKALGQHEFERAIAELGVPKSDDPISLHKPLKTLVSGTLRNSYSFTYQTDSEKEAVRKTIGTVLTRLAEQDDAIVVLDGDVQNSTFTELVRHAKPEQFIECYIAEQLMVSAAIGMARAGMRPVVATFAAFLTRAYDQIRMAAISDAHICFVGTHVGISIGQDGPSQMGLEDTAMMRAVQGSIVVSPCDAVSAAALMPLLAGAPGIRYIRAIRAETDILYGADNQFSIGGSATIRASSKDQITIVATGVCVHEAIKAHAELKKENILVRVIDMYSIKPVDSETLRSVASLTPHMIVVEDHWYEGGLGDAVLNAFVGYEGIIPHITKLAVTTMPHSGKPEELRREQGIDAAGIVKTVRKIIKN